MTTRDGCIAPQAHTSYSTLHLLIQPFCSRCILRPWIAEFSIPGLMDGLHLQHSTHGIRPAVNMQHRRYLPLGAYAF